MKKICMITTISMTMKNFVIDTALFLHSKHGYDVTLICNTDDDFACSLPETINYIPVRMERGVNLLSLGATKHLYKIFKENSFDMVQYTTPNASLYASIAAFFARVPIRLYCQWGVRYVGFSGIKKFIFKMIEKATCILSTDIRTASAQNKAFAVNEGLFPDRKASVVGEGGTIGVDLSVFDISRKGTWNSETRKLLGLGKNDFVYGFSGRVTTDKGCAELFSAFRQIWNKNKDAKLMIVGPVEDSCGLDSELLEWVKNCESVVFTGYVSKDQMQKYYAAMDVLVHPTYREGFGMVIQEAGAMAVPVITTKIPGASEVMEDGVSCVLVEPKNVPELEKAMSDLLSDTARCKEIGSAAYERTKCLFERSVRLELQRKDYEELLKDVRK